MKSFLACIVFTLVLFPAYVFPAENDKPQYSDETRKWALLSAGVISAAWASYSFYDYSRAADAYDRQYDEINNTTVENYYILTAGLESIKERETVLAVSCGAAAALCLYTLADVFFVHAVFPEGTKAFYDPGARAYMLSYGRRF